MPRSQPLRSYSPVLLGGAPPSGLFSYPARLLHCTNVVGILLVPCNCSLSHETPAMMFQAPPLCVFTSSPKLHMALMVRAPPVHTLGAVTRPQWPCRFYLVRPFSSLYGSTTVLMSGASSSLPWTQQFWLHHSSDSMVMLICALLSSSGQAQ